MSVMQSVQPGNNTNVKQAELTVNNQEESQEKGETDDPFETAAEGLTSSEVDSPTRTIRL